MRNHMHFKTQQKDRKAYRLLPTKNKLQKKCEENNNKGDKDSNYEVWLFFGFLKKILTRQSP